MEVDEYSHDDELSEDASVAGSPLTMFSLV